MARTPYIRHLRHSSLERTRHSNRFLARLEEQADRLSITASAVFAMLISSNAKAVEATEPEEPEE